MFSKEFIEKFEEFKESFYKTTDLFDELYVMQRKKTDEMIMIAGHLDCINPYMNWISKKITKEKK